MQAKQSSLARFAKSLKSLKSCGATHSLIVGLWVVRLGMEAGGRALVERWRHNWAKRTNRKLPGMEFAAVGGDLIVQAPQ